MLVILVTASKSFKRAHQKCSGHRWGAGIDHSQSCDFVGIYLEFLQFKQSNQVSFLRRFKTDVVMSAIF